MVRNIAKSLIACALLFGVVAAFTVLILTGKYEQSRVPPVSTLSSPLNVSGTYSVSQRKAIKKSRLSAVRVLAFSGDVGNVSVSTGTYFVHGSNHYILTVQHGLFEASCDLIQIESDGVLRDCTDVVAFNQYTDYAILKVDPLLNRTPIRFPQDFVKGKQRWTKTLAALTPMLYTGYPNTIGPVTLAGKVMGMSQDDFVYFNSYAWAGSSGSGVFDMNGKLVGYIVAIDVGQTEYGYDVLENVILVVPNYKIDWAVLLE